MANLSQVLRQGAEILVAILTTLSLEVCKVYLIFVGFRVNREVLVLRVTRGCAHVFHVYS